MLKSCTECAVCTQICEAHTVVSVGCPHAVVFGTRIPGCTVMLAFVNVNVSVCECKPRTRSAPSVSASRCALPSTDQAVSNSGPLETTLSPYTTRCTSRTRRAATSCLSGGCSARCTSVVTANPVCGSASAVRCASQKSLSLGASASYSVHNYAKGDPRERSMGDAPSYRHV